MTAARWAQLDSGNAEPWLAVAAEARAPKGLRAAFDDAMFHVASADRHDPGWGALSTEIIDHVPPDDANLVGSVGLLAQAAAIEALRLPAWSQTSQYCSEQELRDSNRREICERIATVLADRSDDLVGEVRRRSSGKARRLAAGTGRGGRLPARMPRRAVMERHAERARAELTTCGTLAQR